MLPERPVGNGFATRIVIGFALVATSALVTVACRPQEPAKTTASSDATEPATSPRDASAPSEKTEKTEKKKKTACLLDEQSVADVLGVSVSMATPQGNWGIASTCTYSTTSVPDAVLLSSVASTDLSSDRLYDGVQEIDDLGDEAVWVPALTTLSVVDRGKNLLLRIKLGSVGEPDQRLAFAKRLATLAIERS